METSYNLRPRKEQRETTRSPARRLDVLGLTLTNHVTAPHERPMIHESMQKYRADVKNIDSEIADLYEAIVTLQQRKRNVKGIIEGHKNLLRPSPMRSLPAEILCEIFAAYCDMHTLQDFFTAYYATYDLSRVQRFRRSRMTLLHVCQRWRMTALSSPRLWMSFRIVGQGPTNARLSQKWLDAAASVPLDLIYDVDDNMANLHLLIAKLPQCGRLRLHVERQLRSASRQILRQLSCAPELTKLALISRFWNSNFMREWTVLLFRNAPLLTSLTTNAPPDMLLPLSNQVTHLHLSDRTSPFDVLMYLKNLKELEFLRIDLLQKDEPETIVPGTAVQSNVQTWVSRREYRDSSYENLFDHLTLPRLRCLDIDFALCPADSLRAMFKRSSCQLESLYLHLPWPLTPREAESPLVQRLRELLAIEQVNEHLQRFMLLIRDDTTSQSRNIIPTSVLELLSAQTGKLPKLIDVRFTASHTQAHLVEQLLRNRVTQCESQGVVKLEYLALHLIRHSYKQVEDYFPFLDSYRQEGVKVRVVVHEYSPFQYLSGEVSSSDSD